MNARNQKKGMMLGGFCVLVLIAALVVNALQSNLMAFFSPSQAVLGKAPQGSLIRIAGHVKKNSLRPAGHAPRFEIADDEHALPVLYGGLLPDLFIEGGGAVVQGRLDAQGVFTAYEVLARHDERYMPREVPQKHERP